MLICKASDKRIKFLVDDLKSVLSINYTEQRESSKKNPWFCSPQNKVFSTKVLQYQPLKKNASNSSLKWRKASASDIEVLRSRGTQKQHNSNIVSGARSVSQNTYNNSTRNYQYKDIQRNKKSNHRDRRDRRDRRKNSDTFKSTKTDIGFKPAYVPKITQSNEIKSDINIQPMSDVHRIAVKELMLEYIDTEDKEEVIACWKDLLNQKCTSEWLLDRYIDVYISQRIQRQEIFNELISWMILHDHIEKNVWLTIVSKLNKNSENIKIDCPRIDIIIDHFRSIC